MGVRVTTVIDASVAAAREKGLLRLDLTDRAFFRGAIRSRAALQSLARLFQFVPLWTDHAGNNLGLLLEWPQGTKRCATESQKASLLFKQVGGIERVELQLRPASDLPWLCKG